MKILTTKKRQALIQEFVLILQKFHQADQHYRKMRQQYLDKLKDYPELMQLFEQGHDASEKRWIANNDLTFFIRELQNNYGLTVNQLHDLELQHQRLELKLKQQLQ